jgi:hypothetical protein
MRNRAIRLNYVNIVSPIECSEDDPLSVRLDYLARPKPDALDRNSPVQCCVSGAKLEGKDITGMDGYQLVPGIAIKSNGPAQLGDERMVILNSPVLIEYRQAGPGRL